MFENTKIAVIGLGYVGLPLAIEFGKKFPTIGFDVNLNRINELNNSIDSTLEIEQEEFAVAEKLKFTSDEDQLKEATIFIVTVPTPIDVYRRPNLGPLLQVSKMIGRIIKKNDIVIFESTVYPGATEDDCVPVIEKHSGFKFNKDFYVGYSPERINPGDKQHRVTNILKVTSGSNQDTADKVDALYRSIVSAGTFKACSIKVAEAAKVIENTQRDVNIALINEFAIIFNIMGIDTTQVLKAAQTKWNFLPFKPGLVGGHCISVDPYYLTHKASSLGYSAKIINSSRQVNDSMASFVANKMIMSMVKKRINIAQANILVMGLSFKEDCPDIRNSKVLEVVHEVAECVSNVDIYDPWIDISDLDTCSQSKVKTLEQLTTYDGILIAVAHSQFCEMSDAMLSLYLNENSLVYDLKNVFSDQIVNVRL